MTIARIEIALVLLFACPSGLWSAEPAPVPLDFARDIKPIFAQHCHRCHGAIEQQASLRLDSVAGIRKGGDSGAIYSAGHSGDSLLIAAVTRSENRMPAEADPLAPAEIERLKQWVDAGAQMPDEPPPPDPRAHWSFQRPVRPAVPNSAEPGSANNPIDAFLAQARQEHHLTASPAADRAVQLRRVYLDLVGLPPMREQLHAFLADEAPGAYERVVDRLLASPQYGERWGRHWMDVWRYSDWAGYGKEVRDSQQHIWRWRDWIVESLNADRGYDRMIVEMLAGDEVAPDDPATLRATGFVARNWYRFNRNVWLDNAVEHTGKAFLGLTFNCARCHNHRYDPIVQTDYYRLRAFFEAHDVRVDSVPGQADVNQDGVARIFDAHPDRKTFLFVRGQESQPKEDDPLSPGTPEILGGEVRVDPVRLPAPAHYPALQPHVREALLAQARLNLTQATTALDAARQKLTSVEQQSKAFEAQCRQIVSRVATWWPARQHAPAAASPAVSAVSRPVVDATSACALAEKHLATTRAELESVELRIAADNARYAVPQGADLAERAAAAVAAVSRAATCMAEEGVVKAERDLFLATPTVAGSKEAEAIKKAETALADARKKLETTETENKTRPDYPLLDKQYPATSTGRRLALARWIANERNPLTARVAVNHMWLRHFGQPLVSTVFDFGMNGKQPTHPALLDWLAVEFMDGGWSMKPLHRLIVTSQAYRMSSGGAIDDPRRAADPDNRYLWRMNLRRMEAETVRDSLLHVAGQLDLATGGPDLDQEQGLSLQRRSLYFRHANEKQVPFLKLFDAASVTECYRRSESVVPQQALALANSPLAIAQSRILAGRLWQESQGLASGQSEAQFVTSAFEQVLSRTPSDAEREQCARFIDEQAARLSDTSRLTAFGGAEAAAVKPSDDPRQRAREDLVHVLLNHNDFVSIR